MKKAFLLRSDRDRGRKAFIRIRGTGKQVDFAYEMRGGMESRHHLSVIARSMHSWDVTEGDHPKAWK